MTTTVDAERQQQQIQQLVDHNEITNLVYRLGAYLDDRRFDEMRSLFVKEATVRTPGGTGEGRKALIAQAKRTHQSWPRRCVELAPRLPAPSRAEPGRRFRPTGTRDR
jgi:hypothetical protein